MAPISKKRRLNDRHGPIEELTFDPSARSEYLTGFSKRKQARKEHARETAARIAKEEKLRERKQLRDQRKADLEQHVHEINKELQKQTALANGQDPDEILSSNSDEDGEEFAGLSDTAEDQLLPDDAEYIDEDKYTTVTVEAMGESEEDEEEAEQQGEDGRNDVVGVPGKAVDARDRKDEVALKKAAEGKRPWAKDGDTKKVKKKKFRYESKAERAVSRHKQKSKNSAAAKARRNG